MTVTQILLSQTSDQQMINEYLADCELQTKTSGTIEGYKSRLLISAEILRKNGLSIIKLDKNSLRLILLELQKKRINGKPFSYNNIYHYFAALSSFVEYQIWNGTSESNVVRPFMKRYLRQLKPQRNPERKLITVTEMAMLINSIIDPRAKAVITLLAKTGIRRAELINIDINEIDWGEQSILLKPPPKRTNCVVFFDDETARVLHRWIRARQNYEIKEECNALFVNEQGKRLKRHGISDIVTKYAERIGLHNTNSNKIEDHFTPHCCRHWFTTQLRKNNMRRELIQELRGDSRSETIDIYDHIDKKELKRAYLAAIPQLGVA